MTDFHHPKPLKAGTREIIIRADGDDMHYYGPMETKESTIRIKQTDVTASIAGRIPHRLSRSDALLLRKMEKRMKGR